MAFCELKYFSRALEKNTAADILLPDPHVAGPYATLYLLHGLSDDHTIWQRRTSIERYVSNLPLVVVMPDSGRGFYTDAVEGMAYETAIVRDLREYVERVFQVRAERDARVVAGLSMGGYGAAKFALKFPDLFCAGASLSGAVGFAHRDWVASEAKDENATRFTREFARVLGEHPQGGPNDLYALAAQANQLTPEQRPTLRIDCGIDDFLIGDNRAFHAYLDEIGLPHTYREYSGAHNWEYWDTHIQDAIRLFRQVMGI